MLTKEQKQTYIENGGLQCPHCESTDINAVSDDNYDDSTNLIECNDCQEQWREIYTLTGIEDVS